ncbi:SusD/RagB family nutrient-binding outer membrane lipoprotein [Aureibaculum marinum]|uniref:SusD/RagB family nutrient-binding outer membrane lipoprotein n=1 Tax=Aureibaculum marinum TaxID=2487930 RepID=A0A3N4N3L1_9FLAO|nr:SusD/RagB family nutrient-binding outer membrane lipoprotein [Aureibaculum marinum]RPD90701.1 SusD/RagB family nutrient-binding outer membrane lipoprotein [Aureibaculum marinum]
MKKIFQYILALSVIFVVGCDKDDFAETNSNPSELSSADTRFQVTKTIEQMYNNDYTIWFYNNFDYIYPWSQITTAAYGDGNTELMVEMDNYETQETYPTFFANIRDIRARIDALPEEEKVSHKAIRAMTFPIAIHTFMSNTDLEGSLVYSEGAMAPYTTPPLITPVYDNQEKLFNTWLDELDAAIPDLLSENQIDMGSQDLIYGGDYTKWAKFANLLKLRIAARLVNKDRARAISIVEEVVNSPAGYMENLDDDFIYQRSIKYYGTGNTQQPGIGAKNLIDFMVANKDPRTRVLFDKNDFNGEVVQAFIDAGKELPPYVEQYVVLDADGNFSGWSGPGEPWVRYFGVPLAPDAKFVPENDIYFSQGIRNRISVNGVEKQYTSTSNFSERLTRTGYSHTYPTKPGGRLIQLKDNYPPLNVIFGSSAETNLYLAEFKLLGANLPEDAQEYFNKGVELSVRRMDLLAKDHRYPYYEEDPVYQDGTLAAAGATMLRESEITELLSQPAYDLSTDGLEKVYIQQMINHAATPGDTWTTVRRSGIPKAGSSVLPREPFLAGGVELTVPRRFKINEPLESSKNYANEKAALEEQGITPGTNDPEILNTQRYWFDMENPQYGAGPKN